MPERQRRYSEQTIKRLWALSGNECYMTECSEQLAYPDKAAVMGRIAHIRGWSPSGPRPVVDRSDKELCAFDNLILLCPNHHARVDDIDPDVWTIDRLETLKREHEDRRHRGGLDGRDLDWVVEFTIVHAVIKALGGTDQEATADEWPTLRYDERSHLPTDDSVADSLASLIHDPTRALLWAAYVIQELEIPIRAVLPSDVSMEARLDEIEICREDDAYNYILLLLDVARRCGVILDATFEEADWVLDTAFHAGNGNPPDPGEIDRACSAVVQIGADIMAFRSR